MSTADPPSESCPADSTGSTADTDTTEGNNGRTSTTSSSSSAPVAKTPVSLLQELYVRRGITPKYDLVQIEGAVHEPTFKYRVTVGDFVATGTGQSKKKAKHAAAKSVLEKMRASQQRAAKNTDSGGNNIADDGNPDDTALVPASKQPHLPAVVVPELSPASVLSPYDDGIEGNPVGELQELCINRRVQPPAYEVSLEEGQPHERKFIIACVVGKQSEMGTGKSKKLAKRQAAARMLKRLKSQPAENEAEHYQLVDEDDLAQGIATMDVNGGGGVGGLHRNLKAKEGSKLHALLSTTIEELAGHCEDRLEEISEEQGFHVTYADLEERSSDGKAYCLVQMSTSPMAVCFGSAEEPKAAREAAALDALQYLKIMTK